MAASLERLRDRWERMAPRERTLLSALAVTLVICLLAWVGFSIRDGLIDIENKNDLSRDALRALAQYRSGQAIERSDGPKIGKTAVELDTYLDEIVNEIGINSPRYPSPEESTKGDYIEVSMNGVKIPDITIYELKDLLQRIETKNPAVVVKDLRIKRDFRQKDKLDVELSVAAYRKAGSEKKKEEEE